MGRVFRPHAKIKEHNMKQSHMILGQHEACQGIHDYLIKDLEGLHAFPNSAKTWFLDIVLNGIYFLRDPLQPGFERKKIAHLGQLEVCHEINEY